MVLFLEEKGPASQRKNKHKSPNHAIEDMAEGVLNGMFCHYEPPDPSRYPKHKRKSILRNSKNSNNYGKRRSSSASSNNRVRWIDEDHTQDLEQQQTQPKSNKNNCRNSGAGCNIAEACYEAGLEVGACGPKLKKMDTQQAIAVAKARSPRERKTDDDEIVFDSNGNPMYANPKKAKKKAPPPPPPPPPPPSKKERFFPQLCGVRINCADDDDSDELHLQTLASSSQSFDYDKKMNNNSIKDIDDGSNSLVEYDLEDDNVGPKQSSSRRQRRHRRQAHTPKKKQSMRQVIQEYEVKQHQQRRPTSDEDDDDEDWEKTSTTSSSSFFRRMWPRKTTTTSPGGMMRSLHQEESDDDTDSDMDLHQRRRTAKNPGIRKTRSRSLSPGRRRRHKQMKEGSDSDSSGMGTRKTDNKSGSKKLGGFLRSRSKSPSRSSKQRQQVDGGGGGDWDDSIPIVRQSVSPSTTARKSSPGRRNIRRVRSRSEERAAAAPTGKKLGAGRHSLDGTAATGAKAVSMYPPRSASPAQLHHGQQQQQQQQRMLPPKPPLPHSSLHPAHPLNQGGAITTAPVSRDDVMERQSFITAHRQGFDGGSNVMLPVTATGKDRDDMLERQSFIMAHREGFDGSVVNDDMLERQSFITAHRQGFDPALPPHPRATGVPMSHDEMMERHSFITAHRQGMNNMPAYPAPVQPRLPPGPNMRDENTRQSIGRASKSPRRGRSKSPGRSSSRSSSRSKSPIGRRPGSKSPSSRTGSRQPQGVPVDQYQFPPGTTFDPQTGTISLPGQGNLGYGGAPLQPIIPLRQQPPVAGAPPVQYPAIAGQSSLHQPTFNGGYVNPVLQGQQQVPTVQGQDVLKPKEEKEETKDENELSWEERTRQAWERLRGGVESTLGLDTSKDEEKKDVDKDTSSQSQSTHLQAISDAGQPHSTRRVSFSEPQQIIYYDDQDENRSVMSHGQRTRKKKQFRGAKLINNVFGKRKKGLSRSASSDTHGSLYSAGPSYSSEWGSSYATASADYDERQQQQQQQAILYADQALPGSHMAYSGGATGQYLPPQRTAMGPREQNGQSQLSMI